jgi:hypothetical protein
MNRTGDTATELGLYATECCGIELLFEIDDTFCRCPKCSAISKWEMVDVVVPWTALEQEDPMVAA